LQSILGSWGDYWKWDRVAGVIADTFHDQEFSSRIGLELAALAAHGRTDFDYPGLQSDQS
jgi:hypothetical protein